MTVGGISRPRTVKDEECDDNDLSHRKTESKSSSHDMPFTEEELTKALSKAALGEDAMPKVVQTSPV